jgi:hypothetical protein
MKATACTPDTLSIKEQERKKEKERTDIAQVHNFGLETVPPPHKTFLPVIGYVFHRPILPFFTQCFSRKRSTI